MKDLEKRDTSTVDALLADIARYERAIGELVDRNDLLSAQLEQSEQQRQAALENQLAVQGAGLGALQTAVMRLAGQQSKSTDLVLRLLAEMLLKQAGPEQAAEPLVNAMTLSESYSHAIEGILSGRTTEYLTRQRLVIDPSMELSTTRASAEFTDELDARQRTVLILHEDSSRGMHEVVFPVGDVPATALRGVTLELMPRDLDAVRVRVRTAKDPDNNFEVTVDLHTGLFANFRSNDLVGGRRNVMVQPMRDGWKSVDIQASLTPSEASGSVEIALIAMESHNATSSRRGGTGKEAFALRGLQVMHSAGLTEAAMPVTQETEAQTSAPQGAEVKTISKVHMPGQEARRAEKRAAYLASGAYTALQRWRGAHRGKRAFILGNGPSINTQDLTLLKDEVTFVTNWFVNHPQYAEINPSYYCVSSHEMFGGWGTQQPKANPDWLGRMLEKAGPAHKFFSYPFRDYLLGHGVFPAESCDFLLFDRPKYQVDQRGDINLDLTQPMDDGYTGIITFCLPLAHFMGIEEIYLLGCDCDYGEVKEGAPKSYFYDFSMHTTRTTSTEGLQRAWAEGGPVFKSYEVVRDRFALDGVRIMNATAGGRLEVFPRIAYESLVPGA